MKVSNDLANAFHDCKRRGCTREQMQGFINRARSYWFGNAGMLVVVESLQLELEGMA